MYGTRAPTCAEHAVARLERHRAEVVHARARAGDDHRVLAADLVACERVVRRELRGVLDDVEVRQRGLDHDDVGTLSDVALLDRGFRFSFFQQVFKEARTMARLAKPFPAGGSW